jgi:pyrroline-5-carboxylate reductase
MLAGLQLSKTRYRLVVHDRNPGKLRDLKKHYKVAVEPELDSALKQADLLIVAVRPDSVRELLGSAERLLAKTNGGVARKRTLAISLAAGIPLRMLSKLTGPMVQWARAMPSPVCRTGRGLTAVTFPRGTAYADRKRVHDLFARVGQVIEIPETKFDAFTVTYSSSHGYHALATLAKAAEKAGLDRSTALLASVHALADGIIAWRDGSISLESLIEEAVTPGGIAAATTSAMDAAGYERAVRQGVAAGLQRARANASK